VTIIVEFSFVKEVKTDLLSFALELNSDFFILSKKLFQLF